MTQDRPNVIALPQLIPFREFAERIAAATGGRGPSHTRLLELARQNPPAFRHVQIGKYRYMTPDLIAEYLLAHTKDPAPAPKAEDPLAATRERVARERARKATPKQRRTEAA